MLKIASFDIVFQEVPNEVTLALNISGCPHRCEGCHSKYLWEDTGEPLTEELLDDLLLTYGKAVTCVCFMGGDAEPEGVMHFAHYVKKTGATAADNGDCKWKTAWYSGSQQLPDNIDTSYLDFLKLGPYVAALGGLSSPQTNQRFYRRNPAQQWEECTHLFRKKSSISSL